MNACWNPLFMGLHHLILSAVFVSALALAKVELSTSYVLKGSVRCLDCNAHDDLSGIKVQVKCSQVKKLGIATTRPNGTFQTKLPTDSSTPEAQSTSPPNCLAKIVGAPTQLYVSKKNMVSKITKAPSDQSNSYTVSTPLRFHTSCPLAKKDPKCMAQDASSWVGSSKTVDLPLPPEWGLAPSSYYLPWLPIIGIP